MVVRAAAAVAESVTEPLCAAGAALGSAPASTATTVAMTDLKYRLFICRCSSWRRTGPRLLVRRGSRRSTLDLASVPNPCRAHEGRPYRALDRLRRQSPD